MKAPTPEQIREAREKAGHTQAQAAELIHSTRRAWQNWELGSREMHAGLWELYLLRTSQDSPPVRREPRLLKRCVGCRRMRLVDATDHCEECRS